MERLYDMGSDTILVCEPQDAQYPRQLLDLKKSPSRLYYRGNIDILNDGKKIAVIGMRQASGAGLEVSRRTGEIIAGLGVTLINGLAIGCDTAALQGALATNGKCVAVLPCGLDQIYPKSNQSLAEQILEKDGCLVSEYAPGVTIQKYFFTDRDRLQSALSNGVIIVESEIKGGTMYTANCAIKQQRRLACYYSKLIQHMSGNNHLIESGKAIKLLSDKEIERFVLDTEDEKEYEQLSLFS